MAFCENCGNKMSDTAKFCRAFGAKVDASYEDNNYVITEEDDLPRVSSSLSGINIGLLINIFALFCVSFYSIVVNSDTKNSLILFLLLLLVEVLLYL